MDYGYKDKGIFHCKVNYMQAGPKGKPSYQKEAYFKLMPNGTVKTIWPAEKIIRTNTSLFGKRGPLIPITQQEWDQEYEKAIK